MKSVKYPLLAALVTGTLLLVGCGEDRDPRISDADAMCLKIIRMGGTCNGMGGGGGGGGTSTVTVTQTVVNTNSQ